MAIDILVISAYLVKTALYKQLYINNKFYFSIPKVIGNY